LPQPATTKTAFNVLANALVGDSQGVDTLQANEPSGARDDARLRALVDEYHDFIWRSIRRLGVPEADTDDAVQEVFLVASRRLGAIALGSERAFLFGTAMRVASTQRRGASRRRETPDEHAGDQRDSTPGPEELTARRRARATLDAVLAELPLDLRTVFVLFELEELTAPEIASLVEIPLGTVASRLRRAREAFREAVQRHQADQKERTSSFGVRGARSEQMP
jgi:RNA polymerase sigma-70 factor, ECF subfamily